MSRGFNEQNRFYNVLPDQRQVGLKFVSQPIAETSLQKLKQESDYFNQLLAKKLEDAGEKPRTQNSSSVANIDNENLSPQDIRTMLFNYNVKYIKKPILTQLADKRTSSTVMAIKPNLHKTIDVSSIMNMNRFKEASNVKDQKSVVS